MINASNLVFLKGNVGNNPEVRYNDNDTTVAKFALATKKSWKDRSGQWQDKTTWHNIQCWGDFAKKVENTVKKGMRVAIVGEIVNESWDDKDGKKCYKSYVQISEIEILQSTQRNDNNSNNDLTRMP